MIDAEWLDWPRLVDAQGVVHLAYLVMPPGDTLCDLRARQPGGGVAELVQPDYVAARADRMCVHCTCIAGRQGSVAVRIDLPRGDVIRERLRQASADLIVAQAESIVVTESVMLQRFGWDPL